MLSLFNLAQVIDVCTPTETEATPIEFPVLALDVVQVTAKQVEWRETRNKLLVDGEETNLSTMIGSKQR